LPSDGLTTKKIIAALRRDHAEDILAEADDLIEIALIKLVSQVGTLRSSSMTNFQSELFEEYAVPRRLVLIVKTQHGNKKVWKNLDDLTIAEAEGYVSDHQRPRTKIASQVKELGRLIADSKSYAKSPNEKLVKAWAAAQAAKKKP